MGVRSRPGRCRLEESRVTTAFAVNFFIRGVLAQFAHRGMSAVPRVGDKCVFNETRYAVATVEWCMDDGNDRQRINIELEAVQ